MMTRRLTLQILLVVAWTSFIYFVVAPTVHVTRVEDAVVVGKWYWTEYHQELYQCKVMKGPEKGKYLVLVDLLHGDRYVLRGSGELFFRIGQYQRLENQ